MKQLLLVGIGGGLGAILRWKLGGLVLHLAPNWKFPIGTFAVNVLGCLIAGVLGGLVLKRDWPSPDMRLLLFTGILGGFTTFSAFGLETALLLRRGENGVALAYVLLSVIGGIAGLWIAMFAVAGPHRELPL